MGFVIVDTPTLERNVYRGLGFRALGLLKGSTLFTGSFASGISRVHRVYFEAFCTQAFRLFHN